MKKMDGILITTVISRNRSRRYVAVSRYISNEISIYFMWYVQYTHKSVRTLSRAFMQAIMYTFLQSFHELTKNL